MNNLLKCTWENKFIAAKLGLGDLGWSLESEVCIIISHL